MFDHLTNSPDQTSDQETTVMPLGLFQRFNALTQHFSERPDTEHEQAFARLIIVLILMVLGSILVGFGAIQQKYSNPAFLAVPIALVFTAIQFFWIIKQPGINHYRRIASVLHDVSVPTFVMHYVEGWGIAVGFTYLICIIGNGVRFGSRYLLFAAALSQIAILLNVYFTEYLQENYALIVLSCLSLTAVPIYNLVFIAQLKRALAERQKSLARAIHAEESQRKDTAHNLHDNIAQQLSTINCYASLIAKLNFDTKDGKQEIDKNQATLRSSVAQLQESVETIHGSVNGILQHLWPEALDELGLLEAVKELIDKLQNQNPKLRWQLNSRPCSDPNPQRDICLYRIVQEATTNIMRHSDATIALIDLGRKEYPIDNSVDIALEISDNGKGFVCNRKNFGFGISGMRERAKAIGGSLVIESDQSYGTAVRVTIPRAVSTIEQEEYCS